MHKRALQSGGRRVVFVTREPMLHHMGGSTTCALNLLTQLRDAGAEITVVVTSARSRSPRLWFRTKMNTPAGIRFVVPGTVRVRGGYAMPHVARAYARAGVRVAERSRVLRGVQRGLMRVFGGRLEEHAWDLSEPTEREMRLAEREIERVQPDAVIANYAFWGPLLQRPKLRKMRRVVLMHDLLSARCERFAAAGLRLDCTPVSASTEMAWLSSADCVLAAEASEADAVRPRVTAQVLVQPMRFAAKVSEAREEEGLCLFVGSNIVPNRDGLEWFLQKVWPLVRSAMPAARMAVVGSIGEVLTVPVGGVELRGVVPRIEDEYARAAVCVVPLLVGSGVKIKLLEALAYGKATVATSVGMQGLEHVAAGAVAVRDEPAEFAEAVVNLLRDGAVRERLRTAGMHVAEEHFGAAAPLTRAFTEAVLGSAR